MAQVLTGRGDDKPQGSFFSPIIRTIQEKLGPRKTARRSA